MWTQLWPKKWKHKLLCNSFKDFIVSFKTVGMSCIIKLFLCYKFITMVNKVKTIFLGEMSRLVMMMITINIIITTVIIIVLFCVLNLILLFC